MSQGCSKASVDKANLKMRLNLRRALDRQDQTDKVRQMRITKMFGGNGETDQSGRWGSKMSSTSGRSTKPEISRNAEISSKPRNGEISEISGRSQNQDQEHQSQSETSKCQELLERTPDCRGLGLRGEGTFDLI